MKPTLTLLITTECNGGCLYCYADHSGRGETINVSVAIAAIKHYFHDEGDIPKILISGGGEPTMRMDVIREIKRYLTASFDGHKLYILTNGMFSADTAEWIANNFSGATVSYDGPEGGNGKMRPSLTGKDVTEEVERNIRSMSRNIPVRIRMTVGNDNLHLMGAAVRKAQEMGARAISFMPFVETKKSDRLHSKAVTEKEFVVSFLKAKHFAESIDFTAESELLPIGKKTTFCGFEYPMACVTPDGTVTSCFESFGNSEDVLDFSYGKISEDGLKIDRAAFSKIIARLPRKVPGCVDCPVFSRCAGGCPARHFRKTGDIMKNDPAFCEAVRYAVSEWENKKDGKGGIIEEEGTSCFVGPFGQISG